MIIRAGKLFLIACAIGATSPIAYAVDPDDRLEAGSLSADWNAFDDAVAAARQAMVQAPQDALTQAREAETLIPPNADEDEVSTAIATVYWLQAEALNRTNASSEAQPLISQAIDLAGEDPTNKRLRADILMTQGRIAQRLGNIQTALESFLEAHEIFRVEGVNRNQASALQKLGDIHYDAGDFEQAISYYEQALEVYDEDPEYVLFSYNNTANSLRGLGRYEEAADLYQKALDFARELGAPDFILVRVLTNLAHAQALSGDIDAAETTADEGLAMMPEGEMSGWEPFLWGVKAEVAADRGEYRIARTLMERTFEGADLSKTTMPYREMHQSAYEIYQALGLYNRAFEHLQAFKRLEDEALSLAASTNSALMSAQFDFTNQELQIEQLRLQRLEQDVAIAEARARQQRLLFGSAAFGGVLILAFLLAGYVSMRRSRDAIGRVNEKLNTTNKELEKANKAKSEFLATTSHEIRTPLNGILGMSQAILLDRSLSKDLRERLKVVETAGKSMKAIVDDLLDVAKIETGKVTLDCGEVDLHELVEDACRLWKDGIEQKGLTLNYELGDCPEKILADEQRVRQILFNLLSNAVKFTENGQIDVILSYDRLVEPGLLTIRVKDTGIGVPQSEFTNIFKPFHQVDGAMTRKYSGTGLGLSIVQTFCEAMGGKVHVESVEGEGSEFIVELPLEAIAEPENHTGLSEMEALKLPESISDVHLLIYQDDFMAKMVMEAYFEEEVASIVVADTQEYFLEALASRVFHFAILPADSNAELINAVEAAADQTVTEIIGIGTDASILVSDAVVLYKGEYEVDAIYACIQSILKLKQGANLAGSPQETSNSAA